MFNKISIPLLTLIVIFSCTKKSSGLKQDDIPSLIQMFLRKHVQHHKLNDDISERIFYNYINSLDYGKYYFYQVDIDNFKKHRKQMDNYIILRNYDAVFEIFGEQVAHGLLAGAMQPTSHMRKTAVSQQFVYNLNTAIKNLYNSLNYMMLKGY